MGESGSYYGENLNKWAAETTPRLSRELQDRVARYNVPDEEIREYLFSVSVRDLCIEADRLLQAASIGGAQLSRQEEKVLDIIAWGVSNSYLTDKQKWCVAAFVIYETRYNVGLSKNRTLYKY